MNAIYIQIELMRQYRMILTRNPERQADVAEADTVIAQLESSNQMIAGSKGRPVSTFRDSISNTGRTRIGQTDSWIRLTQETPSPSNMAPLA